MPRAGCACGSGMPAEPGRSALGGRRRPVAARRGRATRSARRRVRVGVLLACALVLPAVLPQLAQARCITRLPVAVSLPDGRHAATYTSQIRVRVTPRGGRRIRNLRVELYTFSGRRMAASPRRRLIRGSATLTMRLASLFSPMQVGAYTLVVKGEPNRSRSCGPKETTRLMRFRACRETLPVTFPRLPGGVAADYQGFLSVAIRSRGAVIGDVESAIYGFDGSLLGRAPALPALFGESTLHHELARPLGAGQYTVVVEGLSDDQPRACGRKRAQATMTFG